MKVSLEALLLALFRGSECLYLSHHIPLIVCKQHVKLEEVVFFILIIDLKPESLTVSSNVL